MPVASDPNYNNKRRVLELALTSVGSRPYFPLDHLPLSGGRDFEVDLALERMRASQIVLADLSLARPSCYFEVGLAQAARCAILVVAEAGTELHQLGERES